MYNNYLDSINKTNEVIKSLSGKEEIGRIAKSEQRWASSKQSKENFKRLKVKIGEIYQFDFGKNFIPEMSYEHRGLVIGVKDKLIYVLPIFSYKEKIHTDAFHPKTNPESISHFYLLKASEYPFIKHDSVIKLNDLRSVSINRIQYKHNGKIEPSKDDFKLILNLSLQKHYPSFYHEYTQLLKKNKELEDENQQLLKKCENLENMIEIYKNKLENKENVPG
ncbi:type II toxin-antitoxin system PemK/MazF family toxin [Amedibacterium intestinale]|jgi:hypothetical protein|uniref:type II toxin-antitoxin system PemK/MazF family toxin n=1 Tax=Amedibacterium intestinale TaxID=2583452 RepID=UPI000E507642|nr:type II toxin-antitoxin system PemK/MazF family toxin [Amedibacterium intestinale]RHO18499.1 hypothetical protein DW220_11525 [Eubacterium sp. AM18-26]RHO22416.1 hypothetical protein DW212_11805 [Eubacterium sp. AM18-10LB-B]